MPYRKDVLLFFIIFIFLLVEYYILINKHDWVVPFNLLPLCVLILVGIFYFPNWVVFLMVFVTPFSIGLRKLGITQEVDLSIPTEPLMIIFSSIYLINQQLRRVTPKSILQHPITQIILIQLIWMLITSLSSEDILVSAKYLVARLWFVLSGYFLMVCLFSGNIANIKKFIWAYLSGLSIITVITIIKHAEYNFHHKAADWIVAPFYNDHTAFGAILALFTPFTIILAIMEKNKLKKIVSLVFFILFITAVSLSYARAAWLSIAAALLVYITLLLKIKFKSILIASISLIILLFISSDQLLILLGRNKTDSESDNFYQNLISSYNIKNDASNLERINRWSSAIRMFQDKPIFGFGPGTYQFFYAPYQLSREKTIISTNFGTGGNTHSEYLRPLSEEGVLGLIIMLFLTLSVLYLGYALVYTIQDKEQKLIIYGAFLGLITYFVHGIFNNFLDTDKLSLPFWAFIAMLVSIATQQKNKNNHYSKIYS